MTGRRIDPDQEGSRDDTRVALRADGRIELHF
jgi:hypothetical protein